MSRALGLELVRPPTAINKAIEIDTDHLAVYVKNDAIHALVAGLHHVAQKQYATRLEAKSNSPQLPETGYELETMANRHAGIGVAHYIRRHLSGIRAARMAEQAEERRYERLSIALELICRPLPGAHQLLVTDEQKLMRLAEFAPEARN